MSDTRDTLIAGGLVIVAAIALYFIGYVVGGMDARSAGKLKEATSLLASTESARVTEHKASDAGSRIGVASATQAQKIRTVTQEVIRYVPQFIPDHSRLLSDGFVVLHDAAATGDTATLAAGAIGMDGASAAVAEDDAIKTIAFNYGECNEAISRANSWIELEKARQQIYGEAR